MMDPTTARSADRARPGLFAPAIVLAVALRLAPVSAQEARPPAPPPAGRDASQDAPPDVAETPVFRLLDVDGRTTRGTIEAVQPQSLHFSTVADSKPDGPKTPRAQNPPPATLAADRVLRIDRVRPPRAPQPAPSVLLANGDRLAARATGIENDALIARWNRFPTWPPLKLPLETVRGVVATAPETIDRAWELEGLLLARRDEFDLARLARGDRLTGEITEWKNGRIGLKGAAGEVSLDADQVRALGFNATLVSFPKIDGRRQLVGLADGSFVTVKNVSLQDGIVSAEAAFGGRLQFPLDKVDSLRFLGGSVVWLSDLPAASYRHEPFVSGEWKLSVDRTVGGRPLRLRDVEYPKGLGMHSRAAATWTLPARARSFLATAGIDDETRGRGSVVFAVEVDGRRVFTSPPQSGTAAALAVGPIDLRGAKSLTLIVDYGELGDVQDHADWCDANIVLD